MAVGTRPAEVCGEDKKPIDSRSAISLRMVAGEKENPSILEIVLDPTGIPVEIKESQTCFNTIFCRPFSTEESLIILGSFSLSFEVI